MGDEQDWGWKSGPGHVKLDVCVLETQEEMLGRKSDKTAWNSEMSG